MTMQLHQRHVKQPSSLAGVLFVSAPNEFGRCMAQPIDMLIVNSSIRLTSVLVGLRIALGIKDSFLG